jgi:hypothetical protein
MVTTTTTPTPTPTPYHTTNNNKAIIFYHSCIHTIRDLHKTMKPQPVTSAQGMKPFLQGPQHPCQVLEKLFIIETPTAGSTIMRELTGRQIGYG